MIISYITDRLGNQLFQYAAAKALAVRNNTIFKIDKRYFNQLDPTGASYELDIFCIPQQFATDEEIKEYTWPSDSLFYRVIRKVNPKYTYVERALYKYDNNFRTLGENVYLKGWWQSYKYFEDSENSIRTDLTFKKKPEGLNKDLVNKITHCNSVSIHVRRGDYVTNLNNNQIFNVCSLFYYQSAIDIILSKIPKPHFFIFSDDKDWIQKEMKIYHPHTFVLHNKGNSSYEDMRLKSLCKHNIIANSSFSWWGAWLNSKKDKIVIAPKTWVNDPEINTQELCPPSWIRI